MHLKQYLVIKTFTICFILIINSVVLGQSKNSKSIYLDSSYSIEKRVEDLLNRMTLEEKIGQINMPVTVRLGKQISEGVEDLTGNITDVKRFVEGAYIKEMGPGGGLFTPTKLNITPREQAEFANELQKIATEKNRLKIPLMMIEEGTHGLMASGATIFPEGPAIGSTWNMNLIRNIYSAVAKETRAVGSHQICTIAIELNRDPRLGRNMETYTEDPYLGSEIAESIVMGAQGDNIAADDKAVTVLCHYPGQSQSISGLERSPMEISERMLREVYLPPWVAGIKKAGALGVMPMHPAVDGVSTHASKELLTDILRDELGFEGLTISEGRGIGTILREGVAASRKQAGELAIKAGLDVSISSYPEYMNLMVENVNEGKVSLEILNRSVRRILRLKFLMGLFDNPFVHPERTVQVVHSNEHQELALQAAREGIVLLKNERNILPLEKNIKSIAIIGPNANHEFNLLGDYYHQPVIQKVVTILEGIKNKVSSTTRVTYVKGCNILGTDFNEFSKARDAAKYSDIAIVVVGENERKAPNGEGTNGEGMDICDLDLTGLQEELVKTVYGTGTPTVVILVNGRPLSIRWIAENIPAIVESWIPGEKGGDAVADVLFGEHNPSGKLPVTFPRHVGQLPVYYNHKPPKTFGRDYVNMPSSPLFEFGYGLSYTKFEYSNLRITPEKTGPAGEININLRLKNIGNRSGCEVVQLYINDVVSSIVTPVIALKGFKKIELKPGEEKQIEFKLTSENLSFLNKHLEPVVEPGIFEIMVGSSCKDIRLKGSFEVIN